jgi:hypothetical protein
VGFCGDGEQVVKGWMLGLAVGMADHRNSLSWGQEWIVKHYQSQAPQTVSDSCQSKIRCDVTRNLLQLSLRRMMTLP